MRTLVLSDLNIGKLHHAYVCVGASAETVQQWWNDNQQSSPQLFTYQTLGVDEARDLKNVSGYTTEEQTCIIISAQTITREAQNALLKLFEEPVTGIHFFLVIPSFDLVLPTLASRLQKISIEQSNQETFDVQKFLKDSAEQRLATIEKLLKKANEGDEAKSAITRSIADAIENALVENPKLRNQKIMETLQTIRNYQNLQGASHKILLEYLAFAI